jgi:hypothetical protein
MSELLSHPLDPLGARVRADPSRKAGGSCSFRPQKCQHNRLAIRLVGGRATPLVYGLPRPARGTTPRERRFKSDPGLMAAAADLIRAPKMNAPAHDPLLTSSIA